MCFFSTPKAPPPVQLPAAPLPHAQPQPAAQTGDFQAQASALQEKQKRLRRTQASSTLVTGGQGLTAQATTAGKQLAGV